MLLFFKVSAWFLPFLIALCVLCSSALSECMIYFDFNSKVFAIKNCGTSLQLLQHILGAIL
jgi:hypothetical protein